MNRWKMVSKPAVALLMVMCLVLGITLTPVGVLTVRADGDNEDTSEVASETSEDISEAISGEEDLSDESASYFLWIAGRQVTELSAVDLTVIEGVSVSGEGYAMYDAAHNILKLKNATIQRNFHDNDFEFGIRYDGPSDFKIEAEGNNYVSCTLSAESGGEKLTGGDDAKGADTTAAGDGENGTSAEDADLSNETIRTTAAGLVIGPVTSTGDKNEANVLIEVAADSFIEFTASNELGNADVAAGIFHNGTANLTFSGKGRINAGATKGIVVEGVASGGTFVTKAPVTANISTGDESENNATNFANGIAAHAVIFDGGTVNINSGYANNESNGIDTRGAGPVLMNDGNVRVTAGYAGDASVGINSDEGITICGGTLEVNTKVYGSTTAYKALAKVPIFADGVSAIASTNTDPSTGYVEYKAEDNDSYRWFKSTFEKPGVDEVFEDVKTGAWYVPAVQYVYDKGIMVGKGSTFGIGNSIKREDFVQTLYSMSGKPEVDPSVKNPFSDVKDKPGYPRDAILWANENGIVKGNADGTFGVGKDIQRQAVAAILYQYANYIGVSTSYDDTALDKFSDKAKVQSWALVSMKWAVTNGIIGGKGSEKDGYRLDPAGKTTREECAAMLKKIDEMPRK